MNGTFSSDGQQIMGCSGCYEKQQEIASLKAERDRLTAQNKILREAACGKCSRALPPDGDCYGCEVDRMQAKCAEVQALVDSQAEDDGLWFMAVTAPEAYLQQALRKLHAVIEEGNPGQPLLDRLAVAEAKCAAFCGLTSVDVPEIDPRKYVVFDRQDILDVSKGNPGQGLLDRHEAELELARQTSCVDDILTIQALRDRLEPLELVRDLGETAFNATFRAAHLVSRVSRVSPTAVLLIHDDDAHSPECFICKFSKALAACPPKEDNREPER